MNKKEDLTQVSDQDLLKKEKMAKIAFIFMFAMIILQAGIGMFLTYKQGFSIFTVMPLFFIPMLIVNRVAYQTVLKEKKRRGL